MTKNVTTPILAQERGIVGETIEQRAEDVARSMVPESWNGSIEIVAALLRELELARRVADAAMAIIILDRAITQINIHCADYLDLSASDEEATEILLRASANASFAHASAVREYRARVEAAAFMARPEVRRGLEGCGEMEDDQ